MPRQYVRQTESRKPDPVDDAKTPTEIADNSASDAQSFLERVISQIRQILGTPNWDDAVPVSLTDAIAGGVVAPVVTAANNGLAPAINGVAMQVLVDDGTLHPTWRQLSYDDIAAAFAVDLVGGGTVEVGASVVDPAFTVGYAGGLATEAVLSDSDGSADVVLATPFTSVTSPNTFTKTANNASVAFTVNALKGAIAGAASAAYAWRPRAYWGVGIAGLSTEAGIEALASSALASSLARTITAAPGAAEYIYYAYPASYGAATFTVGGFEGGFDLISAAISVTNAHGVTQDYRLYRSTNPNLGSTTVTVS